MQRLARPPVTGLRRLRQVRLARAMADHPDVAVRLQGVAVRPEFLVQLAAMPVHLRVPLGHRVLQLRLVQPVPIPVAARARLFGAGNRWCWGKRVVRA